jgi:hypothetical protein
VISCLYLAFFGRSFSLSPSLLIARLELILELSRRINGYDTCCAPLPTRIQSHPSALRLASYVRAKRVDVGNVLDSHRTVLASSSQSGWPRENGPCTTAHARHVRLAHVAGAAAWVSTLPPRMGHRPASCVSSSVLFCSCSLCHLALLAAVDRARLNLFMCPYRVPSSFARHSLLLLVFFCLKVPNRYVPPSSTVKDVRLVHRQSGLTGTDLVRVCLPTPDLGCIPSVCRFSHNEPYTTPSVRFLSTTILCTVQ